MIFQAANTGLTGGSTPWGDDYDREIVLVSLRRLKGVHLIDGGRQVVCLPGATLDALEKRCARSGREPHSVIGSSCIGASVLGGICNNSGGALIQRGPAYTEMSLYAEVRADGSVALVNHLGLPLGNDPEEILARVERGELPDAGADRGLGAPTASTSPMSATSTPPPRPASTPTPAGCARPPAAPASSRSSRCGSTPSRPRRTPQVFYIGTNDPDELTEIRRHILASFETLPIAGEYIHRDAYDVAAKYGKDTFLFIQKAGTDRMPALLRRQGQGRRPDRAAGPRRDVSATASPRRVAASCRSTCRPG